MIEQQQTFSDAFYELIYEYKKEYGELKLNEITKRVCTSKYVRQLIFTYKLKDSPPPNEHTIVNVLGNHLFFTFGHKRTVAIGGAIVLFLWNKECNLDNSRCSDQILIELLERLFTKCKSML